MLLTEGTNVPPAREAPRPVLTEYEFENDLPLTFSHTRGLVLTAFSAQNIGRLVTVFNAARRAGREFVIDLYAATIAEATGRAGIPKPGFDGLRVFVPHQQRVRVKRAGAFDRVDRIKRYRIFPEELRDRRGELVFLFRASTTDDLERADCLEDARLVWSQWRGYLDQDRDGVRDCRRS
ncbi:MAG: hypothetical protein EP329_14895 [Deltaproteobacteria bacterium]|nr:MAG: hypothetical protein EP329_14895 [Deltaproteobacteria bacterium]